MSREGVKAGRSERKPSTAHTFSFAAFALVARLLLKSEKPSPEQKGELSFPGVNLPAYKTNRLLWLALSLLIFLLNFDGIELVLALLKGRIEIDDLLSFEVVAPIIASVVGGWLLQCAIVIVISWKRTKSKPKP